MKKEDCHPDPIEQLRRWRDEAAEEGFQEPNAMTLATVAPDGRPSARIVLLRQLDPRGLSFFTNYESRKGRELAKNPLAALVFYWDRLHRQVRVLGSVEPMEPSESADYFKGRPRGSQIAAWASNQSDVLPDRATLEELWSRRETEFDDTEIPLPPHWGGYRLNPTEFEFWEGKTHRLHDRVRYRRVGAEGWVRERLAP